VCALMRVSRNGNTQKTGTSVDRVGGYGYARALLFMRRGGGWHRAAMELKRMLGMGAGRRAIDIQKTINLNAPVDRVFRQWANYQNFPHFMPNVREVKTSATADPIGSCLVPRGRGVECTPDFEDVAPARRPCLQAAHFVGRAPPRPASARGPRRSDPHPRWSGGRRDTDEW
jgi:hypothetical protein